MLRALLPAPRFPLPFGAVLLGLALAVPAPAQRAGKAQPVFADGQAQLVEAFADEGTWIQHDLWVETESDSDQDGKRDRVHVDVTRPGQTESEGLKVPVIYESSPYFAGTGSLDKQFFWDPRQELNAQPPERPNPPPIEQVERRPLMSRSLVKQWVPRGFAVVHSSSPGTGLSEGCPTVGAENESLAPKAVIDWLNGRARGFTSIDGDEQVLATWCTGKVGMTGTSYNGTLCVAAATTGVEGLAAIIPAAPNTSYYHYYRANGLVRHPGGYMGEDVDVLYNFIDSGDPATREWCDCNVRDVTMKEGQDRVTGDYNDFWASRDYLNHMDAWRVPTLLVHGLNDWNVMPDHSVRIYEALKARGVPAQIYLHQGGHAGPPSMERMNRWFTRYLYGVENGVEDEPRAWVVREGDRPSRPTPYPDYPNPAAALVELHPTRGGSGVGGLQPAGAGGQGSETLVDDVSEDGASLASAERSPHRLLYATPELTAPVHLSGTATLTLRLASSKPACNLSVWVVALPWTGDRDPNADIITRGWADPQNHASLTESAPLEPGEFVELTFDLEPDDQVVPAGQRIGLMVFSSDRDFTLWPEPGTELTLDLDATTLRLPVVGGREALERAFAPATK